MKYLIAWSNTCDAKVWQVSTCIGMYVISCGSKIIFYLILRIFLYDCETENKTLNTVVIKKIS